MGIPPALELVDMLEKHALLFTDAAVILSEAKMQTLLIDHDADSSENREIIKAFGSVGLGKLKAACILSDMQEVIPQIERLEAWIGEDRPRTGASIAQGIRDLLARIKDDLAAQFYFHLDQRDIPFYVTKAPFGDRVALKFPRGIEDIDEAGKCLALQRSTACVFHLMRVMELGVQKLGSKLKVAINPEMEAWAKIVDHIDKAIKALPSATQREKARKAKFAEASAHLNVVRLAWRNKVMHPKQTYDRQQAWEIYNATKAFMASLAELV